MVEWHAGWKQQKPYFMNCGWDREKGRVCIMFYFFFIFLSRTQLNPIVFKDQNNHTLILFNLLTSFGLNTSAFANYKLP